MWQQWVNGVLGVWIVLTPFLGFTAETFMWTLVISGAIIAILGFWGAAKEASYHHQHHTRTSAYH